jgi:uncharacterized protein with HEPN domain
MSLINIGEMIKNLSDEIRQANPNVPWKTLADLSDIIANGY